jgi:type VI secretion system protein ImpG
MSEDLFPYYESELTFITDLAKEFAGHYKERAKRLGLDGPQIIDPHVERLIQAFALLTGRIQRKLDDDFPELTDALLSVLYPHYLAPIPALGVVQLEPDPHADIVRGFPIERDSVVETDPVEYQEEVKGGGKKELKCQFRTCYPVTLWPVTLTAASLSPPPFRDGLPVPTDEEAKAILSLRLDCPPTTSFAALGDPADPARQFDRLRFHLDGPPALVAPLYELLFTGVIQVLLRPAVGEGKPVALRPEECLSPVGFEPDEGVLPYPRQSFMGYRLLTEFFTFPRKFFFFDLVGLSRVRRPEFGRQLEVVFFLRRSLPALVAGVNAGTFRLGCAPVINLFEQQAEPINLTQAAHEYRVVPKYVHDGGMEVYGVQRVVEIDQVTGATREYSPFYSFRHGGPATQGRAFWYTTRRPSLAGAKTGSEVYISLIDLGFRPWTRHAPVLQVDTTCTNRELIRNLRSQGQGIGLQLQQVAPLRAIRWVGPLTDAVRPPRKHGAHWRLLSHLSLNHLSLADTRDGCEALKEVLRLYNFAEGMADVVEAILSVEPQAVVERVAGAPASGFARGVKATVTFDRQKCLDVGPYLFACVLERFLGLYVTLNSFSQLVAKVRNEKGELKRWPPRAGNQQFL